MQFIATKKRNVKAVACFFVGWDRAKKAPLVDDPLHRIDNLAMAFQVTVSAEHRRGRREC